MKTVFLLFILIITVSGCKNETQWVKKFHNERIAEGFRKITVTLPPGEKYNHIALLSIDDSGKIVSTATSHYRKLKFSGNIDLYLKWKPDGFVLYQKNYPDKEMKKPPVMTLSREDNKLMWNSKLTYSSKIMNFSICSRNPGNGFLIKAASGNKPVNNDFERLAAGEQGWLILPLNWHSASENPPEHIYIAGIKKLYHNLHLPPVK